ncbi:hypothetical protein MAPG_03724 [Magnaporthiopsis poae ATCC 64411]|uniref:Uncharacterized protein n=1 Tax=Magnaporthiopsis poae (strain ATCC 64411 / 73-15) TaxID=644358 RepID=A0A0C4DUT1_MAGP6|nr:hypothetical protein MAPG_03724 [Magnaporthiopsis poae ATCC 64411]
MQTPTPSSGIARLPCTTRPHRTYLFNNSSVALFQDGRPSELVMAKMISVIRLVTPVATKVVGTTTGTIAMFSPGRCSAFLLLHLGIMHGVYCRSRTGTSVLVVVCTVAVDASLIASFRRPGCYGNPPGPSPIWDEFATRPGQPSPKNFPAM